MKLKPLTHKMKNRINERGEEWDVLKEDKSGLAHLHLISPVQDRGKNKPYCVWVIEGRDVLFLKD